MSTHGSVSYFAVEDSAASTLRNLSANVTSVDFNLTNDVHDDTTYGQVAHTKRTGLRDGQFTVNGFWDKTASTGSDTVISSLLGLAVSVGFEYGPEGNGSTKVKYSGECVLESYAISDPVADLVSFTAVFQCTGTVTKGTFT